MKTTAASSESATKIPPVLHRKTRFAMRRLIPAVAAALLLLGGPSAQAAITPVASYDFNNNATPAGVTAVGSPSYSNGQLVLNGSSCLSVAAPTSATDNFGIEVICTPTANDSYNYSLSLNNGANNGWGILQLSGAYLGVAEGAANGFFGDAGAGSAVLNVSVHLALVRAGGVTTLYRNGVAVGTTTTISRDIPTKFTIGANQLNTTPTFDGYFKGNINEVRVFTFAPGEFNPATDLLNPAFTQVLINSLSEVRDSSLAWGDYDNNGFLDFLLTGSSANGPISERWRNTGRGSPAMGAAASVAVAGPGCRE